ncbi:virB7 [Anaplasma ovis str. Haibei]|uniref:VirB7 n=1 Tax=Anaplasma ovis str. Haibei TaxID=1248439 RepID=A0A2Z2LG41_9RICK|nr:virB7 [Anaplasma ovis str. Haibei]
MARCAGSLASRWVFVVVFMRFSRVVLLLLVAAFGLQGCGGLFSKGERRIKSPCVRAGSGHTCERHSVNQWWLG